MGLFHKIHQKHDVPRPHHKKLQGTPSRLRLCRFEQMEPRQLLSVTPAPTPIHVGMTYFEDANGNDAVSHLKVDGVATSEEVADIFEVAFTGGASGTTLQRLEINTGSDTYFDITDAGVKCGSSFPLKIISQDGITITSRSVTDGGTTLVFEFTGFDAGEKLVFTIDVDEKGPTSVAEGGEFGVPDNYTGNLSSKATLTASFVAPHTLNAVASAVSFYDTYEFDGELYNLLPDNSLLQPAGTKYFPSQRVIGEDNRDYTAAADGDVQQVLLAEISGHVYYDRNNNGVMESTEAGIGNVMISLRDTNGNPVTPFDINGQALSATTTTTDANGYYHFYVKAGTYGVVEGTVPAEYSDGKDTRGTISTNPDTDTSHDQNDQLNYIALSAGQVGENYNFGEIKLAKISGHVYFDANSGHEGLQGVTITLLDPDNNAVHVQTDSSGYYHFDSLTPGVEYTLLEGSEALVLGYVDWDDVAGTVGGTTVGTAQNPGDEIDGVVLLGGDIGINYDFHEVGVNISGRAYVDVGTHNGTYDDGTDIALPNAAIRLLDASGNPIAGYTTTTATDGTYSFTNLRPGTYGVEETERWDNADSNPFYIDGDAFPGNLGDQADGNNKILNADLTQRLDGTNYDFTEWMPASLAGQVFVDLNDNNKIDSGTLEKALPSVTVKLLDSSGNLVKTTQTDANGKYSFTNLMPGKYTVVEVHPTAYIDGKDYKGSVGGTVSDPDKDTISDVTLDYGVDATSYNFTELLPATISGYVFQDGPAIVTKQGDPVPYIPAVRDGKLTPDDTRLSGIKITLTRCDDSGVPLLDANNMPITRATVTGTDGYYEFTMLEPGTYSIVQEQPANYISGVDTAGDIGGNTVGMVVNQYQSIDPGTLSMLSVDATGSAIVKITIGAGDVGEQYNFSEVLVQSDPPDDPPPFFPPPTPTPPMAPPVALPFVEYRSVGIPYSMPIVVTQPMAGGSGGPGGYSWHLSIINASQPRRDGSNDRFTQFPQNTIFDPVSWTGADVNQSQWLLADENGTVIKTVHFGMPYAIPVTGDWDGSGTTKVGVFIDGLWFLDINGSERWDENDFWAKLGKRGDQPVSGDWDGDGKTDIGIFGQAWIGDVRAISVEPGLPDAQNLPNGRTKNVPPDAADAAVGFRTMKKGQGGRLRSDVIDHVFEYGTKGDRAITGDWNGDGVRSVGIFRNGVWFLDMDGNGRWSDGDQVVEFGQEGDLPVVGDWTGDGISKLGLYRDGTFYLDVNNNHEIDAADKVFALGQAGDKPVAGDWTGDGVDKVGVYQEATAPAEQQTANAGGAAATK